MRNADRDIQKALLAALPADLTVTSINQIEQRLTAQGVAVSRRTLQRHLGLLEATGRIIKQGRSVAVTYRLAEPTMSGETAGIALSPAGREVLNLVTQAVIAKRPVTYNQDFLDRYIPNTTRYLPESLRIQLHDMGRTGTAGAPRRHPSARRDRPLDNRPLLGIVKAGGQHLHSSRH